jgi:ABC-2 type transport system ATP-binding protein
MADIKELCERVIVIHQGKKIYDGQLDRLASNPGSRKKIIRFVPQDGSFPETWQSRHGETKYDAPEGKFTVRVPGENVVAVSQEILTAGLVADITIEDVPLEDIIAEFFQHHDS